MKKGFTIVELIAVIVILGVTALIATPIVNNSIRKSKEKAYDEQIKRLTEATKEYVMEYKYASILKDKFKVSIKELKEGNYIEDVDIINPLTNEVLVGYIQVEYSNNKYNYHYTDDTTGLFILNAKPFEYAYPGVADYALVKHIGDDYANRNIIYNEQLLTFVFHNFGGGYIYKDGEFLDSIAITKFNDANDYNLLKSYLTSTYPLQNKVKCNDEEEYCDVILTYSEVILFLEGQEPTPEEQLMLRAEASWFWQLTSANSFEEFINNYLEQVLSSSLLDLDDMTESEKREYLNLKIKENITDIIDMYNSIDMYIIDNE